MSNARQLAANLPREGGLSNRNIIINGDFSISQRGDYTVASAAVNGEYWVDRWKISQNLNCNKQHKTDQNVNGTITNAIRLEATTSATGYLQLTGQGITPSGRIAIGS